MCPSSAKLQVIHQKLNTTRHKPGGDKLLTVSCALAAVIRISKSRVVSTYSWLQCILLVE